MHRNKGFKGIISILCSATLLFGSISTPAFADDAFRIMTADELAQSAAIPADPDEGATSIYQTQAANLVNSSKTAVDFFSSRGSSNAVSAILNSKYSGYTNVGSSSDATSLENMRNSILALFEYNERYRTGLGLPELRVNDLHMSYAIADANYSDRNIEHAQQFYCGENLAWNWGTDPYIQWYDQEKALYDAGVRDFSRVGHYLNIINPTYEVTGFARNHNGSIYGITFCQVFGLDSSGSQTVTDYYNDFMKYYNDNASLEMHRMYNPTSGEHLYTSNIDEANNLIRHGWRYEGVAWIAPVKSNTPVYRLYNPINGDHHYTTDAHERDVLMTGDWRYEGIGWYSMDNGGEQLYRLFNPYITGAGSHHYTLDAHERDVLSAGDWIYEGTCWSGLRA